MLRIRTINHKSVSTTIVDELRQRIITGVLADNAKLAEREIAQEFGSSRVPVREAFKVLESEGYLEVRPRSGTVVKPLERKYMRTVGDVYVALIPLIILHALPHYTESLLKKAEGLIEELDRSEDPVQTITLLTELRDLLHSPSTNTYAYKICRDIYLMNRRVLATISNHLFDGKFPTDGYKRFIRLIRAREYDEAVTVYQDTVRLATANIQHLIEENIVANS
jgi:DNA-binding GntR family transcriptional regulator